MKNLYIWLIGNGIRQDIEDVDDGTAEQAVSCFEYLRPFKITKGDVEYHINFSGVALLAVENAEKGDE